MSFKMFLLGIFLHFDVDGHKYFNSSLSLSLSLSLFLNIVPLLIGNIMISLKNLEIEVFPEMKLKK